MKLSFNQATAKDCSSLEQDLVLCDRHGFDYIEIRDDMLIDYLKNHSVEELKAFFDTHRLKPHAINALYVTSDMFTTDKSDDAERALLASFLLCCEVAQRIGSRHYIVVPPFRDPWNDEPFPDSSEKVKEDCVRILRRLSDIVRRYDITLAWEPVGNIGFSVRDVEFAWDIVRAVDRDNVGLTLDAFNLYSKDKLNDFAAIRGIPAEKICAVHLNNADDLPIGVLDHCHRRFCDSGEIDLDNFLGNILATGYDGMASIETFRPEYWEMSPDDVISKAYETTQTVVARATAAATPGAQE